MAYCEECGAKLSDDAKFCGKCGHAVKPADAVQQFAGAVEAIVRDIDAPAAAGETVLSSWQGGGVAPVSPETVVAGAQAIAAATSKREEPHQPSIHSSSQSRGEAAPLVKKSKIPKILGTAGVVVIIALIALYVVPLFVSHPYDPNSHVALVSDSSQSASGSAAASTTSSKSALSAAASTTSSSTASSAAASTTSSSTESSSGASTSASSAAASATAASKESAASSASASASSTTTSSGGSASATSSSKGSGTSSTTNSASGTSSSKTSTNTNADKSTSSKGSTASSTKSSASAAAATDYSTTARPKISEFNWLTGDAAKGNVPSGAKRIIDLGSVTGGWKGYIVGSDAERLMNADIQVAQSGVTVAIDWYYVRFGGSGDGSEDNTPTSTFKGTWSGNSLDATGSGRITLAAFWEKDGHQYATGSFIWPDGVTCTVALVRP